MKINTVLFDLDGTILDTNYVILESFQHTYRTLTGKEKERDYIIKAFGEPLKVTMEREFDKQADIAIKTYRDFHYERFEELIDIFPGMEEVIKTLFNKGYKLGVVTSRLKNTTLRGLKKYKLDNYFQCIITADDTDRHKPDPSPVLLALEKLESKQEQTIMIGDSLFDIKCANNAGIKSAVVTWSELPEEIYRKENPNYIIKKAEDIYAILAE